MRSFSRTTSTSIVSTEEELAPVRRIASHPQFNNLKQLFSGSQTKMSAVSSPMAMSSGLSGIFPSNQQAHPTNSLNDKPEDADISTSLETIQNILRSMGENANEGIEPSPPSARQMQLPASTTLTEAAETNLTNFLKRNTQESNGVVPPIFDSDYTKSALETPVTVSIATPIERKSTESASATKDTFAHSVVYKEWQTECKSSNTEELMLPDSLSFIPEKDSVVWHIKDVSAFRSASRVSNIPALISPQFGGGCHVKLNLFDKKGHITGHVELPLVKAVREAVLHFTISVIRPDHKVAVSKKLEMSVKGVQCRNTSPIVATSETFMLTRPRALGAPRIDWLVADDSLRIRIEFQYFPFDAPVFRAINYKSQIMTINGGVSHPKAALQASASSSTLSTCRSGTATPAGGTERREELLSDIRNFCAEDVSQNVEILADGVSFRVCRFLLCARSYKFREIFSEPMQSASNASQSLRSSPRARSLGNNMPNATALNSITITNVPVDCLDQLFKYIHSDSCPWLEDFSTDIFKMLNLFETANQYRVESLVDRCLEYLNRRMDSHNFAYMFEVAERCRNEDFKLLCARFMDSMPGSQVASLMRVSGLINSMESPRVVNMAQ